jgi:hypothetical protein
MAIKSNPVTQSLEFNTHVDHVASEFSFLITDFGFTLSKNEFIGKEFWIVYSNAPITVEILFERGSLPFVTLRNNNMPHDEAEYIDNGDSVEEFSVKAQEIKNKRYQRRDPKEKRALDEWGNKDSLALKELSDDYKLYGRDEHIEYLKEAALTVRKNIEFRRGNMSRNSRSQ